MNDFLVLREDEEPYDFGAIAEAVYKKLGQTDKLSVELNFVSPEEIRRLNNDYRGVDRVTDVLSFPYLDKIKGRVITTTLKTTWTRKPTACLSARCASASKGRKNKPRSMGIVLKERSATSRFTVFCIV